MQTSNANNNCMFIDLRIFKFLFLKLLITKAAKEIPRRRAIKAILSRKTTLIKKEKHTTYIKILLSFIVTSDI